MPDPFAPPAEPALTPPYERPRAYEPRPVPTHENRDRHDRHERREERHGHDRHDHPEPAKPGLFWVVAAVGVGLILLARLVLYFTVADDLPDGAETPALFAVLGVIALSAGLALAAVLQRGLATPWRIALLLGAGFFAIAGDWTGLGAGFVFL